MLWDLLKLYPRVPAAHRQPLTRGARLPNHEANQQLLDEATAEQRAKTKALLTSLLSGKRHLVETASGWHFTLSHGEFEWFLQVLNDIRLGSWLLLGSPPEIDIRLMTDENGPDFWAMEMSGLFQMHFLALADRQDGVGGAGAPPRAARTFR